MPINNGTTKTAGEASKQDGKGPDPGVVDKLFAEWRKYSLVRLSIAGTAWSLGMAALLLAWTGSLTRSLTSPTIKLNSPLCRFKASRRSLNTAISIE